MKAMILVLLLAASPAFAGTTTFGCQGTTLLGGSLKIENNLFLSSRVTFVDRLPSEFKWTGKEPKVSLEEVSAELADLSRRGAKVIGVESLQGPAKTFTVFESKTNLGLVKLNEKLYVESGLLDGTLTGGQVIYSSVGWAADTGNESTALITNCR